MELCLSGVQITYEYLKINWILFILPSILWFLFWKIYKRNKERFYTIDKIVTNFARKMLIVFTLSIVVVILSVVENPLWVVVIMVITGEVLNVILIPIDSTGLLNSQRKKYWRIVKEEYIKYFKQKRLHHKNIMKDYEIAYFEV